MSRTELLITTQPHQKGACTGVWEWRYPNLPAGGHGLLVPSHPNDFRKSCSHALLPPVPNTTNPVSQARRPLSVLGSRTADLQLLLTLCSTPSTAACFWRGGQKFSPGHCTKACTTRHSGFQTCAADSNELHAEAQPQKWHHAKWRVGANPIYLCILESFPPAAPQKGISLSGAKAFLNNVF